jgi:4-hydroxy-3-polyprenylbenzoate decarboxylase
MYANLRDFVGALERAGELVRIAAPVSPILEIAAIADRVGKTRAPGEPSEAAKKSDPRFWDRGGPALLFENVEGSTWPVLINAFGSYRRVEMMLGRDIESVAAQIGSLTTPQLPRGLGEAIAKARQFAPLLRIGPKRASRALCHEVVRTGDDIDLTSLPLIRCWPLDGDLEAVGYPPAINDAIEGIESGDQWNRLHRGRYITLGGVHTIHADDASDPRPRSHNIGMYRVQLLGRRTMAMHWHVHHDGAAHWRSWKAGGKPMPVAIALGGEAVLPYAATAPLPPGVSELLMAGFLNARGIPLVACRTVPLRVPANAEIVIEGFVSERAGPIGWDPHNTTEPLGPGAVFEGPFGDHTGYYSMPDRYPILTVTAITHRRDPIYPTTIVGLPPQEDYYLGKATERLFLPLLKILIPDIVDYDLPMFGAFHNCAFIKIDKQYPVHARRVMHAVWGAGQMAWTKTIFVVDRDVDVHDTFAVFQAASRHCDPRFDVERSCGPLDILDHAAPWLGAGGKMGFDCTRKWRGEQMQAGRAPTPDRPLPDAAMRSSVVDELTAIAGVHTVAYPESLGAWLFVACDDAVERHVIESLSHAGARFAIFLDADVDLNDPDTALFHWVANTDMLRDAGVNEQTGMMVFQATRAKPGWIQAPEPVRSWPPVIKMSDDMLAQVQRRWGEYGLPDS